MESSKDYSCGEYLISNVLLDLQEFFKKAEPLSRYREWIESEALRVYVRKCPRIIEESVRMSLDIAAIEVEEEYRERGVFKAFMQKAHALNPYEITCIEHAHNPFIEKWCRDNNWLYLPNTFPPSFYLPK